MSQCHYNKGINRNGYQFSIVRMLFRSDYKMVHDTTYDYAVVSVSQHYKDPTKWVSLVQSGYHHLIEYNLFSP